MNSDEFNPYDFVSAYKKLDKERIEKKKKLSSNKNNEPDSNQEASSSEDCFIAEGSSEADSSSSSRPPINISSDVEAPRATRRTTRQNTTEDCNIIGPVISIGDFDDGYDIPPPQHPKVSDDSTLEFEIEPFKQEVLEQEEDIEIINRAINVKVYWRKMRTYQFSIRMYQPIESIFEHFAKLEDIDKAHVLLELDNKILLPSDTPKSMNYKFYNFIDGDIEFYRGPHDSSKIIEPEDTVEGVEVVDDEVKFCIKQKDVRHPFFISIDKSDKMIILYIKIAEKLGLDGKSFKLVFDGEEIKYSDTIDSLDLEGDECFDLFKKKKTTNN